MKPFRHGHEDALGESLAPTQSLAAYEDPGTTVGLNSWQV